MEWTEREESKLIKLYEKFAQEGKPIYLLAQEFEDRSIGSIEYKLKNLKSKGKVRAYKEYLPLELNNSTARVKAVEDYRIEKAKIEKRNIAKKYRSLLRDEILEEKILEIIQEQVAAYQPVSFPEPIPRSGFSFGAESDIIDVSDTHNAQVVSSKQVMELNEYNFDVFKKRIQMLSDSIMYIRSSHSFKSNQLYINFLGDFISGLIHDLQEHTTGSIMQQVFATASVFAQFVLEMAQEYNQVNCSGVTGNHARLTIRKKYQDKYGTNFDYLLLQLVRQFTREQENVFWDIPTAHISKLNVDGYWHLLVHGDEEKRGSDYGGLTGVFDKYAKLLVLDKKILSYVHMGHFHECVEMSRDQGSVFVNGCLIGQEEYGHMKYGGVIPAAQWYLQSNVEKGVFARYKLDVSDADSKIEECRYIGEVDSDITESLIEAGF